jgi:hypothetical protein
MHLAGPHEKDSPGLQTVPGAFCDIEAIASEGAEYLTAIMGVQRVFAERRILCAATALNQVVLTVKTFVSLRLHKITSVPRVAQHDKKCNIKMPILQLNCSVIFNRIRP